MNKNIKLSVKFIAIISCLVLCLISLVIIYGLSDRERSFCFVERVAWLIIFSFLIIFLVECWQNKKQVKQYLNELRSKIIFSIH